MSPGRRAPQHSGDRIDALRTQLLTLGGGVTPGDAGRVARAAILYPQQLAAAYRLAGPPLVHNTLVNLHLRERGLCCHWAEDLLLHLRGLGVTTLEFYWAVAYLGNPMREHSSVAAVAAGEPFETGVVLDPWRYSGDLHWSLVVSDRFPWTPHPSQSGGRVPQCR